MPVTFIDELLVAQGAGNDRWYVIHTIYPRFILEICDDADGGYSSGESMFIDECLDAPLLARLARLAGEIFRSYDRDLDSG